MIVAISTGVIAAAAASFAGLHTMVPWSQLYGSNFSGEPRGTKRLALTYDDGPNDPYTGQLLEVLARHDVKATFFLLGRYVEQLPHIVRETVAAGHIVGNHSYSHPNLIFSTPTSLRSQIERTQQVIEDAAGIRPTLFRPPFGGRRPGVFSTASDYGMTPVMWRVTCYDWSAKSSDSIIDKAQKQIRGGDVILLHDGGHLELRTDRSNTVKATDEIIRRYKGEGYEFVTVSQMISSTKSAH